MPVVVDASALAAIVFGEADGPTLAGHLHGETMVSPRFLDLELVSIALKKVRRHPEETERLVAGLTVALQARIDRVAVPDAELFALASATGLSAYDASYLWLARSLDAELVTLDKALARLVNEQG